MFQWESGISEPISVHLTLSLVSVIFANTPLPARCLWPKLCPASPAGRIIPAGKAL